MYKSGFTLVETLITLGIIGVVAAITMPTLINNYKKTQTAEQLKQTYTLLQNAIQMAEKDYGEKQSWEFPTQNDIFFQTYFNPYLKVIKTYSHSEIEKIAKRKCLNDTKYDETFNHYQLTNGSLVSIGICNHCRPKCVTILIDVNSIQKPNKGGIDIFRYSFTLNDGLYSSGKGLDRDSLKKLGCSKGTAGHYCPTLIMYDGWKISKDYPIKY